jgi:DNA-binding MarR family transcriptional regulator
MSKPLNYAPPLTVSHGELLVEGGDAAFRGTLYLLVSASGRLQACREAFGRAIGLTGSQFTVLVGTAYRQGIAGVSINDLAAHVQLAPTHVTTEVGRLIRKGLLVKRRNQADGRGRLVSLSAAGEALVTGVAPFVQSVNDVLFDGVSRAEWAALDIFLQRFEENSRRALGTIQAWETASA